MRCDIVSVRRTVYSGEVSLVVVPGQAGEPRLLPAPAPPKKPGPRAHWPNGPRSTLGGPKSRP